MSGGYVSAVTAVEILNSGTVPSDGDDAIAASVDVELELLADDTKALRNRDGVNQATTFVEPGDGSGIVVTGGNTAGEFSFAVWQLDRRILHANNEATAGIIRHSFDGGYTWATEYTNAGTVWAGLASQTDSSAAIGVNSGAGNLYITGPGNAWQAWAISGTTPVVPLCILADPFNASTYWVGGSDDGFPAVWKVVTVNGGSPTETKVVLVGGAAGCNVVCPGRNNVLAASNDSGTVHLWSITGTTGTAVTPPTSSFITDILWLDAFGVFLLIASNGSTLELYLSATGANGSWTSPPSTSYLVALEGAAAVASANLRGACVVGPLAGGLKAPCLVMIPIAFNGGQALLISADGGQAWKTLPDPLARHQSLAPLPTVKRLRVVNNRVIAYAYQAGGHVCHALSARGGMPN